MVRCQALLVLAVAIRPMALPPPPQATPKPQQTVAEPGWEMLSEEAKARRLALNQQPPAQLRDANARLLWRGGSPLPTYRVEVVGHQRVVDFRSTLQESLAEPLPPATPGFLAGARGLAGKGPVIGPPGASDDGLPPPLIAIRVKVDPARLVHAVRRWTYNREVRNTRREVAEELAAVIKANQTAARKKGPERP